MHLWDFLFYQSTITLKLLQPYNQTPKMWDHTELKVPFDHNKIPLLTLSTKFIVLEKIHCQYWGFCGFSRCYIGPFNEHYHCYRVYILSTRSDIKTDVV